MSTELMRDLGSLDGGVELTLLGKHMEMLRIERGVSKQGLARHAGTSRQQLWRVMTGKSELTTALRQRLATALSVDAETLSPASVEFSARAGYRAPITSPTHAPSSLPGSESPAVADYLSDAMYLATTMRTLPSGEGGRPLKRALLSAVEDVAAAGGRALPPTFAELRRRVLTGEI